MLILIVAGGPDKGRIYELLEEQPVVIGREGDQIKLNDRRASRKHARLWAEGGKWYVRDLHSRHGTILNARPVDNQTELEDGDHLQIGKTLFVLARMPVEQAERMALLGDATGDHAATAPLPFTYSSGGRSKLLIAGGALAAAVLLGSNAALYYSSMNHTEALRAEIAGAKLAAQQSNEALLEKVDTVAQATRPADADPMLRQILAAVQAQREQEQVLNQIHEAVAQLPTAAAAMETIAAKIDEQPEHTQLLQGILAKLEARPEVDALLAEVQSMARAAREQQETLAARTVEQDELLRQTLAEVKTVASPDAEAFAAALRDAVASVDQGNNELLQQVLANLDDQAALAKEVRELRQIVERQPEATRLAVAEIVKSMPTGDDQAVLAAIAELRDALPADATARLDQVLARLDKSAGPEQVAAAVKSVIEAQTTQLAAAVASASTRQTQKLDAVAARLDAQLTQDQLLAALESAAEPDAALLARIDALAAQIETQATQAAKPGDDADGERLAATQQLLKDVLAEVRNREPIEQLRAQVQRLAEAAGDETSAPMLAEILAAVQDRGVDARFAELHDILKAWPAETEAMLKEMLAAVQARQAPENDPAVEEVLQEIRRKALARIDEFDHAIRSDLRSELQQATGGAGNDAIASSTPQPRQAASARRRSPNVPRSALMSPQTHDADSLAAAEPELTQTEQAYKIAFDTGQPVTIGAGVVNAATGEVAEGRTLDPMAARAAGVKHWREWYLMDFFAEKMRLQKQAMRYSGDADRQPPMITLPPAQTEVNVSAMPQPANEADAATKK